MLGRAIRLRDNSIVELAGGVQVRLKVSRRARRVSLRIDRASGEILAVAPTARRLSDAAAFAGEQRDWIAARLSERRPRQPLRPGLELRLFGEPARLYVVRGRASLEAASWERGVRLPRGRELEAFEAAALRLVKGRAKDWFEPRIAALCEELGVASPELAITSPRTRWGSCAVGGRSGASRVNFSWRLALAPPEVAGYVAAHECAHLIEQNHSRRFWTLVEQLVGDPRPHRSWLRANGPALHAFGP
jgi:predicted metal-dependent hydrolase